jgi:Flp pilus assembly secretin CpaC
MRRALFVAALLAAAVPAAMPAAWAARKPAAAPKNDFVALALDEVHTLTFRDPVATVYVGNPAIADVTMIDARHAFVQGKGYGRTNVVALNRDNVQVFNTHITVTGNEGGGTVTLNRGAQRVTLNCAGGRCEPTPMPGDDQKSYADATGQATAHQSAARTIAQALEAKN